MLQYAHSSRHKAPGRQLGNAAAGILQILGAKIRGVVPLLGMRHRGVVGGQRNLSR